jgi:hypothetical protein
MATHGHPALAGPPKLEALGRPLRWVMPETARAFPTARGRRGHCWERRDRSGLVEADTSAVAARRSLDRTAVRAGRVKDPPTSPWSRCAASALGTPHRVLTFHPRSLALSASATVRQRQSRPLLAPSAEPQADARWTTQRAMGSPAVMAPYVSPGGAAEESKPCPRTITRLRPKWCPVPFFPLSDPPRALARPRPQPTRVPRRLAQLPTWAAMDPVVSWGYPVIQ